jgi:hypothetical protein
VKTDSDNRVKQVRKFADARLRYQFFISMVCLIASISFWLLIKLSNEYTLSFRIPVKFVNIPTLRMLTDVSDTTVLISIKAQGYKLLLLQYFDHPKPLNIDLSKSNKSKNSDEITVDLQLMPFIRRYSTSFSFLNEVRSVHPEQVTVKMNKLYSKSVPVKFYADITFAPQYQQFEPYLIKPLKVTVYGTHSMVDSVQFAQPEVIKIRNMTESVVQYVHLNANNQMNKPFFIPSQVQIIIPVQKFTEEKIEIPISLPVQVPGRNIKLFPDKAIVSCIVSMKDFKKLDPQLFTVSAVLLKTDNLYHLSVTAAPDYVRNVKVTPEKVEYLILR